MQMDGDAILMRTVSSYSLHIIFQKIIPNAHPNMLFSSKVPIYPCNYVLTFTKFFSQFLNWFKSKSANTNQMTKFLSTSISQRQSKF